MAVKEFVQPAFQSQDNTTYKAAIDAAIAVLAEIGRPFAPRAMAVPGMGILVESGSLFDGTVIAAANVSGIGAPAANPRIDRVYFNPASRAFARVVGVENVAPVAPALPLGMFAIADILLTVGMTTITNASITDIRPVLIPAAWMDGAGNTVLVDPDGLYRFIVGRTVAAGGTGFTVYKHHSANGASKLVGRDANDVDRWAFYDNGVLQFGKLTVGTLPAAAAALEGARAYVTDSNATLAVGHGNVVAAGGANKCPVYCDGAAWRIG